MAVRVACTVVREGLTEYLENALSPTKRQGFDDHLAACTACRTLLQEIRAVSSSLSRLPQDQMPAEMADFIREAFANRFAK